ncbi:MAG: hypothetical protein M0T70_05165 [Geobacteraceae bacterium]|nr:hypothetical protein [Geobacteraceae bacterium]
MSDTFVVYVYDNYHYMDEGERYKLGVFTSLAEAEQAAQNVVDASLAKHYKTGMTASGLFAQYKMFGDDPCIEGWPFSAWDYAEERCLVICGC